MRPSVPELLEAVQRVLAEVVRPEVASEYAVAQLDAVLGTLAGLAGRVERMYVDLLDERDDLAPLVGTADDIGPRPPLDALRAEVTRQRAALVAVIRGGGSASSAADVRDYLNRSVTRET